MDDKIKKCCPNCSQLYQLHSLSQTPKHNIPLFLTCGHSMCEKCVSNIVKFGEPIECKVCHRDMEVDAAEVALLMQNKKGLYDLFPVNVHMLGELTLQIIKQNPQEKAKKSEENYFVDLKALLKSTEENQGQCLECHNQTTKMCKQCATILCDACFNKSHKNFVIFKNHVLQNIESQMEPNYCKTHKEKPLDYYCKDCSKSICMDCLMVGGEKSCKNHDVASMQEVNEDFIEELGNFAPKVDETFKRLTKTAVDIGHLMHNIENGTGSTSELTKMLSNMEQHFSKLCYIVQKHKQEVMDIVIKLKCSEKESLQKARNDVIKAIKKANEVLKKLKSTSDPQKLKQINLSVLLEDAKQISDSPWYLNKDETNKDPLKVAVNEDLCALISDYIHLEGNANSVYKLCTAAELGDGVEIPPPPHAPVYPPELPKDVRQLNKPKAKADKDNNHTDIQKDRGQAFYKFAPTYRSKSGSVTSLNSCSSDSSNINYYTQGDVFQKPVVQPVPPFAESQHPKQLQEGTQELIYISHIVDPHNFYVQRACHQNMVKAMLREFRNAVSLPKPSINHVSEGKIYLAFNKADNMWQRCRVISIDRRNVNKPLFHVFCIDFGSSETVTIDNLRLLPPAWLTSPYPLAINCSLANCEPKAGSWTNDDAFLIQNIIDNKQAVIHIRHIRSTSNYTVKLECDVTTFEDSVSVAHALVFHDRARMPNPRLPYPVPAFVTEKPKIFMGNNDFKYKSIEEVYITHIVSPDKFFVRKRHLQTVYEKLCEDLEQEYSLSVNTGMVYLPDIGMVCVVNVEKYRTSAEGGAWARGVVAELPGRARVRLLLPDTGEALLVHYTALRHIHHKFTTCAALATECHLAGVTPLNKKWNTGSVALLQKFEEHLLELHVEDNRNRGSIGVTLYDKADPENDICINKEMIKYKFAVTFGLFKFNKNNDVEDQVITNKSPLDVPVARPKPTTDKVTILKKQTTPKKIKEVDLEAKDKGPLRLEAKVLHYQSPSLIYVSLVHQQKAFNELFENMQKYYSKKKSLSKHEWKVGDRCCTICIQSQTWRRAVILELEGENAKVFYSDFACIESVPVSALRELTSDFAAIGDAAIKCHLCGVIPAVGEDWPSLTKEYLNELLDAYKRVFITKLGNFKNKSMPVEVWVYHTIQGDALEPNKSEWRCLNKKIIEQGLGIPDKSQEVTNTEGDAADDDTLSFLNVTGSVREWLQLEPMPTKPLITNPASGSASNCSTPVECDDFVHKTDHQPNSSKVMFISDWLPPEPLPCKEFTAMPTYIDNYGVIYLHDVAQNDTLDLIRKALDVRFKNPDPKAKFAKWTVGEPCIALFFLDNRFYRGRVLEVNEESATCLIHYIDYGNEEICSFANLRKSIALHQIPIQAHKCVLNRIQPVGKQWDRQTLDYIHKSIVEKQCYVKVAGEKMGDIVPIELKFDKLWINDHLVEFEMAVYTDGSKAVVRKFAPTKANTVVQEPIIIESDSGPDYIVEEDQDSAGPLSSQESFDMNSIKGKDWNKLLEEDEAENDTLDGNYITYPKNDDKEFKCNVCVINDPKVLELSLIHDDETNILYNEMFKEVQAESENMPPLNGIFKNKACVALFPEDGLWYRASILEYSTTKNQIKVRYVDYGNIEIISVADVREVEEEWTKLPPATITAKLYGVQLNPDIDISVVTEEYTNTLLDKGPFNAKIIDCNDSLPRVEIRNEADELINEILTQNEVFLKCTTCVD